MIDGAKYSLNLIIQIIVGMEHIKVQLSRMMCIYGKLMYGHLIIGENKLEDALQLLDKIKIRFEAEFL